MHDLTTLDPRSTSPGYKRMVFLENSANGSFELTPDRFLDDFNH